MLVLLLVPTAGAAAGAYCWCLLLVLVLVVTPPPGSYVSADIADQTMAELSPMMQVTLGTNTIIPFIIIVIGAVTILL